MRLLIPNTTHQNLIFFDCEFDQCNLVQFSAFWLTKEEDHYKTMGSINLYVKGQKLSSFFVDFTSIGYNFLEKHGIEKENAAAVIEDFMNIVKRNSDDILFISHGISQDINVLHTLGVDIDEYDTYCTYNHAKALYAMKSGYDVQSLAAAGGFFSPSCHDSFYDALCLITIFTDIKYNEIKQNFR